MLIFIDKRAPLQAKENLARWGQVIEFETTGIVYNAISGHPDIFIYQWPGGLVVSPDLPQKYLKLLSGYSIITGTRNCGIKYPDTAPYNALYTSYGLLHNTRISASEVLSSHEKRIHCNQAYTRCNTIQAGDFILTSDKGIENILKKENIPVFYICPEKILLEGFTHGFFGGCCGISGNSFFICGNMKFFDEEDKLRDIIASQGFKIEELYHGPPVDVGGIFFI
ncbi:MAG: hypothetical protein K0B37_13150 [Bacteroidales bacterium]|nr:hypothetical protein [Bacteroidales bacterium]